MTEKTQQDGTPDRGLGVRAWGRLMRFLASYHSWRCLGIEHVPERGGAVFVSTHSLASYDIFISGFASKKIIGRPTLILGDDLMFRIPGMKPLLEEIGFTPRVSRDEVIAQLKAGAFIGIAPGGMKESIRGNRGDKYAFDWSGRYGFVWVAMVAGVPIVPVVCPNSNDIFTVYENPITRWAYRRFKIPLPIFRGWGPTIVPRPVPLLSVMGAPIQPEVTGSDVTEQDVKRMHARVVEAVRLLTLRALELQQDQDTWRSASAFPYD